MRSPKKNSTSSSEAVHTESPGQKDIITPGKGVEANYGFTPECGSIASALTSMCARSKIIRHFLFVIITFVLSLASMWIPLSSGNFSLPALSLWSESAVGEPATNTMQYRWVEQVRALSDRPMFSGVKKTDWGVARAALGRLLHADNRKPATLAVVSSDKEAGVEGARPIPTNSKQQTGDVGYRQARCLARALAKSFLNVSDVQAAARSPLIVDAEDLSGLSDVTAKKQLHEVLSDRLSQKPDNAPVAIVIYNVQKLRPLTAMLFQSFCDNLSAPRTSALFVFVARIDERVGHDRSGAHQLLEATLWQSWQSGLSEDVFYALLSRIGGNVAELTPSPMYDLVCTV